MSNPTNQHFVPKFYFKLFTGGSGLIHRLDKNDERILLNKGIKGQCAQPNFYGSAEIESLFSQLENQHSAVLKRMRDLAWSPSPVDLESWHIAKLWEAVVFQRARTELEVEKDSPASESLILEMFKEHLKTAPGIDDRATLVDHIERGDVRIAANPQRTVLLSISSALQSAVLISDLDFHLLRNQTDYPFLFGDSPVVFCNTYYQNVTQRGVLGFQTPGLQIFFPIDSRTLLMLVDEDKRIYDGRYREPLVVDVDKRSDVSQLNALQLHHSLNAIYFANASDQEYVTDLWNAHRHAIVQPKSQFEKRQGWLVGGERVDDPLYHTFEPHLNITLDLSFIGCNPIRADQYTFRRRSPDLCEEHKKQSGRAKANEKEHES